jgi:uncharacterized protein YdeI (YjbR/CyaY-like superfamily)
MATIDQRIDQYIINAQEFAQPILIHLRELIHAACPEVKETLKWGMPSFDYKGPLCTFAAFKHHAVFSFWKNTFLNDPLNYLKPQKNEGGEAMGQFGKLTTVNQLPPDDVMLDFIIQAMELNEAGINLPKKQKVTDSEVSIPDDLMKALNKNPEALNTFLNFTPSQKREYTLWIEEAKTETTRTKRLETAIEWMNEGKIRNWKYIAKP